jgi:hypothetical protein
MAEEHGGMLNDGHPKRTVNFETLRRLGFSEDLINEAVRAEERGLSDVEPPTELGSCRDE